MLKRTACFLLVLGVFLSAQTFYRGVTWGQGPTPPAACLSPSFWWDTSELKLLSCNNATGLYYPSSAYTMDESDITGLANDLSYRPRIGPGYAPNKAAVINATSLLEAAVGNPSDCLHVDGSSGPCGTGPTIQAVVTGSRAVGTIYQNTNLGSLMVTATFNCVSSSSISIVSDSGASPVTNIGSILCATTSVSAPISFWVLPGNYYKAIGTASLLAWTEWH